MRRLLLAFLALASLGFVNDFIAVAWTRLILGRMDVAVIAVAVATGYTQGLSVAALTDKCAQSARAKFLLMTGGAIGNGLGALVALRCFP